MAPKSGIFCLEGNWDRDLRDRSSVEPGLEMIHRWKRVPFIQRRVATLPEFKYYLQKWILPKYLRYPILYLAFHGEKGCIVTEERGEKKHITLENLGLFLKDKCEGRIVYFGACKTLDVDRRRVHLFLKRTKALAVCGFKSYVDWLPSTVFDLMVFDLMQGRAFDLRGFNNLDHLIRERVGSIHKKLDFRLILREPH